jgi:2-oxoisovalerate dehydrogenase E1 component
LLSAFEDPNPVMFFEHKGLYRSITEDISDDYYTIPFGQARLVKEGTQVSIITYGMGVHWAIELLEKHPEISADLVDLRTLAPLDVETIYASVKKTGRLIVIEESPVSGGWGSEIISEVVRTNFSDLKSTPFRITTPDVPVPYSGDLEARFIPQVADIIEKIDYALKNSDAPAPWWVEEGVAK